MSTPYRELALRFYHSRIARTLAVGFAAVIVQTTVFEILGGYLHIVSFSTATLIGAECGVLTNFFLNNRISFHDRKAEGVTLRRLGRFHLIVAGSIAIQWLFVFTAESTGQNILMVHVAYASGIVLGFIWNYNWYRLWVWRHHSPSA